VKRQKLKVWTASLVARVIRRRSLDFFSIVHAIVTAVRAILGSPAQAGEITSRVTAIGVYGPGCPSFTDAAVERAPAESGARTHSPRELRAVIHIAG
jgi:hypothetical protein